MTIAAGDKLPEGNLLRIGAEGPEAVSTTELSTGRVALFGLPGAYTGTCTNAHMPSFVRTADAFRDKGIDREEVLEAMEQAIQKAGRSKYGHEHDIRVRIDLFTNDIRGLIQFE